MPFSVPGIGGFPLPPITGGPILSKPTNPDPSGDKGLSFTQLKALWEKHATGPAAATGVSTVAAAIALAESGGKKVVNSIGATGYWQIHPGGNQYLDGDANAAAAVAKYNAAVAAGRDGFTPWTTYTGADTPGHEKTYKKYLPKSGIPGSAGGDAAGTVKDAVTSVPDFVKKIGSYLFDGQWWLRVGMVVGGLVLMIVGVVFFARQFVTGQAAGIVGKAINSKGA